MLADADHVARQPVDHQPARRAQEHEREHDRHRHHHFLLHRVGTRRLQPLLEDHRGPHHDRCDVERVTHRQVGNPQHERRAPNLDRHRQQPVEGEQDRHGGQHRQTPARGVRTVLPIQPHHLLVHLLLRRVGHFEVFVAGLDSLHFRLQLLHLPHRHHALVAQREDQDIDQHGQQNDRPAVVTDVPVDPL